MLKEDVEEHVSQIESGSVLLQDFQGDLRLAANELAELEDQIDRLAPIGRDSDTVHAQVNEIKVRGRDWWAGRRRL